MPNDQAAAESWIDPVDEVTCAKCEAVFEIENVEPFSEIDCPQCGRKIRVPGRLGSFRLIELLGKGGMGGVYRAHDETLGRDVAIKLILPSLGRDKRFLDTFKREAQAAAKLNHPHIAQIYSFDEAKGQPFIVMELVRGQGLDKLIKSGKPLDQGLVMEIGLNIAEGLSDADEIGLIHGDIKPENILLDAKQHAKLVDFGLATFADQQAQEGIWGTPYYIAPERVRRQKVEARSDIYSLGGTLYHALTGKPPFDGNTPVAVVKARLKRDPVPPEKMRPDLDERVSAIVMRMLQREPGMRYPTYASLISDLRKAVQALPRRNRPGTSKKHKKLVIKSKSGRITAASTALAEYRQQSTEEEQAARGEKRARRLRVGLTILFLFLALVMAGGGIGGYLGFRLYREVKLAARRKALALADANTDSGRVYDEVTRAVTNVMDAASAVSGFAPRASNAVWVVMEERLLPPAPPAPPPAASTNQEEAAAASTNQAPAAVAQTNAPAAGSDTNAAAGTRTNAAPPEAGPEGPEKERKEEAKPPPKPVWTVEIPLPETPDGQPPLKTAGIRVLVGVAQLERAAELSGQLLKRAANLREQIKIATVPKAALAQLSTLTNLAAAAANLEAFAEQTLGETREALDRAEQIRKDTENERREAEERRLAEEAARREEERQRREAEERAELVRQERELAEVEHGRIRPLLKANRFEEALLGLRAALPNFRSEEGKAAMQVLIDRVETILKTKRFFVERLNKDPFRWGWAQGGSPEDILGANDESIVLKGRRVPWTAVKAPQFMKLAARYLADAKVSAGLLAEPNLGMAVYCYEASESDSARQAAVRFAERAMEFKPGLKEAVNRLLPPELFLGPSGMKPLEPFAAP